MPIADYKQFLNLRAGRTYHLGYYTTKAGRAVTPEPTVGLPNPTQVHCGNCNEPMLSHPVIDLWGDVVCKRTLASFTVDSDFDYYADTFLTIREAQPNNFYESDKDEEGDYDYAADTYRDEHPEEFTSALNWWTGTKAPTAYRAGSRQAVGNIPNVVGESAKGSPVYVDGYLLTSVQVFDPEVTERYALRSILNYYVDSNTGDTRLGGLILTREGSTFRAKCVRNDWTSNQCSAPILKIDTATATREQMEDFTIAVIRHGNNHAAPWFTKRASFYKVHTESCDLNCNPAEAKCQRSPEQALNDAIALLALTLNARQVA